MAAVSRNRSLRRERRGQAAEACDQELKVKPVRSLVRFFPRAEAEDGVIRDGAGPAKGRERRKKAERSTRD